MEVTEVKEGFEIELKEVESDVSKSNKVKSDEIKSNKVKGDESKSNRVKSEKIKSNEVRNVNAKKSSGVEVIKLNEYTSNYDVSVKENKVGSDNDELNEVNKIKSDRVKKIVDENCVKVDRNDKENEVGRKSQELSLKSNEVFEEFVRFCHHCRRGLPEVNQGIVMSKIELFEHVHQSGVPNYRGCRIPVSAFNFSAWENRLVGYEDIAIIDLLKYGFPLDFDRNRTVSFDGKRNHKGARDHPEFIRKYLSKECDASRIVGPFKKNPLSVPLIVSPLNSVPKSSADERRAIVDLSWPIGQSVNDGISKDIYLGEVINLHYASVEQVCDMVRQIGPGAVIYKRDLRHACRQIPIDPRDYCYLGYNWEEQLYFDTVLLMGQRNAAMACCRTTNAVMYMHGCEGHMGTNYLDDLIGVSSILDGWIAYESLGQLLIELGLLENLDKACPPAAIQIVLGIVINTIEGTLSVPVDRMEQILNLVAEWQEKTKCTKVELQSLIGLLQFVTKCVWQSRVFMNRLLEALRGIEDRNQITLSRSFQKDLKWWSKFMKVFNGTSFILDANWSEPDVTFATDSCLTGCGGMCGVQYFHTSFPDKIQQKQLPIHELEMLAVLVGVRIWGVFCTDSRVQIYCDNEAVVRVINSSRTRDPFMATCLRELWFEVSRFGFQLRAVHLPGEENRVPDWLSRWDLGKQYRDLFHGFISDGKYEEIRVSSNLFDFSDDL